MSLQQQINEVSLKFYQELENLKEKTVKEVKQELLEERLLLEQDKLQLLEDRLLLENKDAEVLKKKIIREAKYYQLEELIDYLNENNDKKLNTEISIHWFK